MITKMVAINQLIENGTHLFYAPELCHAMCEPFGIKAAVRVHKADKRDPKGLTLNDGEMQAAGMSSFELVGQIARSLGVRQSGSLGRGSAQRETMDSIRKALVIAEKYQSGDAGYDSSVEELTQLGMSEKQADDLLVPLRQK